MYIDFCEITFSAENFINALYIHTKIDTELCSRCAKICGLKEKSSVRESGFSWLGETLGSAVDG